MLVLGLGSHLGSRLELRRGVFINLFIYIMDYILFIRSFVYSCIHIYDIYDLYTFIDVSNYIFLRTHRPPISVAVGSPVIGEVRQLPVHGVGVHGDATSVVDTPQHRTPVIGDLVRVRVRVRVRVGVRVRVRLSEMKPGRYPG